MRIDVARHIGAVTREVRSLERGGREAKAIVATRIYETTIDDLWDAISSAERIPRWFLPVSGDLRPGGRYQLEGNAGGEITECEPPRHLALTWEFSGMVSWVEVRLAEEGDGATRLELQHIAPMDAHWEEFGPGAGGIGWDLGLTGLAEHVAGAPPVDPRESMAWMGSEEGKAFMQASGEGWRKADVEGGEEEEAAAARAARTWAAYTGEGG